MDILSSAPAAAPAGAPAPATDNPGVISSPSQPNVASATAAAPAADTWAWDKYAKDEDLGWLQTKGYKGPEDLIKAARSSETLIGRDRIPLPKDWNDPTQTDPFYEKLGRPKTAAEYKLDLPENTDKSFVEAMQKTMWSKGIPQGAASELAKQYMQYGQQQAQAALEKKTIDNKQQMEALKTEWGAGYEREVEHGRRLVREFNIGEDVRGKLYEALGEAGTVRLMNQLGKGLTEAARVDGKGVTDSPTPAQAKYQIGQLQLDKSFMEAYGNRNHIGHDAAVQRMTRLHQMAAPE